MSERPNVILGLLLSAAAIVAVVVAGGLAALGGAAVAGLGATIVGTLSACVFFLAELERVPLSSLVLVALALASAMGFVRSVVGYLREQRLLRELPLERVEQGALVEIAAAAGARRLYLTPARRPAAFCFGLLRPRIVVTSGLLTRLAPDEQTAVVWHEAHHARAREPLKCLLARLAASTFFWIPALRDLLDRYLLAKELAADRFAARRTSRRALAGALFGVVGQPPVAGAIGLADFAAARVDRLFDSDAPLPPLFRHARLAGSAFGVACLALLLALPAKLDLSETARLHSMLTAMSFHGLPGMAAGLMVNLGLISLTALAARRVLR